VDTTKTITHLGLCAGYGGIELGLHRVIRNLRTVALCEIEAFACANLVSKMEAGLMDPESASAQKTLGTSGLSSQTEFDFFAPDSAISRMSKDTSASDSERSLESWNQSVTKRRGEYSQRLKSAHRTSASGSSSWPTIRASEYKDTGPIGSKSHDHMLGKHYLCAVVTQEAANWPTIQARDYRSVTGNEMSQRDNAMQNLNVAVTLHGQAAPANHNTHGNRPESSVDWRTPQANEAGARVETLYTKDGQPARPGERAYRKTPDGRMVLQSQTINQQVEMVQNWPTPEASQGGRQSGSFNQTSWKNADGTPKQPSLAQAAIKELWPSITAHTPDMESSGPNGNSGTYLAGAVKAWATPNAFCYQPPENTEQWTKRAEYQQTEKGVNLHKPVQSQVLHEVEKMWRTPSVAEEKNQNTSTQIYLQNQVGATPKAWATPIMGDSHLASTPEVAQKRIEEGKVTLSRQNPGKLNPRWVETLMGLPVGWVMPSCASPVTIEQTSFDSSATESCLPQPSELFAF